MWFAYVLPLFQASTLPPLCDYLLLPILRHLRLIVPPPRVYIPPCFLMHSARLLCSFVFLISAFPICSWASSWKYSDCYLTVPPRLIPCNTVGCSNFFLCSSSRLNWTDTRLCLLPDLTPRDRVLIWCPPSVLFNLANYWTLSIQNSHRTSVFVLQWTSDWNFCSV